ncbi:2,4-dienoyl-CoA reductase (NADPH2) [Sinosporangium album]|uniref:2,4-dienoyl-CoA reductase (NADPH2) n=1 Tax=Sinosporangium album TaxID=504805 RepID=A0A1G8EVH6_9ACTN|nr:FAD-dependent oxidoreductase [Sinosporangium album]SDH73911.1 2,4-dienoyl-CoA reductase (NADPH2) [Sinosporangium album]
MTDLRHVFAGGRIGRLALPHRVIMGAMHLGLETRDDGGAALAAFYTERVRGGAGLMVTGGAAVSAVGVGGPTYGVLGEAGFHARLSRVVKEVHDAGGLIALQLFHAGRYAVPAGLRPVAPSAVYSRFSRCEPLALTEAQVRASVDEFARGAAHARELGFDAVEIMGSEGYLIDQFLSPKTNLRDDEWGGDAERRGRFGAEVTRAVREAVGPSFPIIVRFSGLDLMDGGTRPANVFSFTRALVAAGADALNVGIGWHESPVPSVQAIVPPGLWIPFAARLKAAAGGLPVIAGNRVDRVELAASILAGPSVDFVSMARPFLADAKLIDNTLRGRPVNICVACNQACIDRSLDHRDVSCMVNPRAGRELGTAPVRPVRSLRVAIIGGGPAGLQAARQAALLGHSVELYEALDGLGGQFRMACKVPGKSNYRDTIGYFTAELARLGVRVHLNRAIGENDLGLLRSYDRVIVASGVRPHTLSIPGAGLPNVFSYPEAFGDGVLKGRVVIIGGGGIAIDLAHLAGRGESPLNDHERFRREHGLEPGPVLVTANAEVTILQRGSRLAGRTGKSTRWAVLAELRRQGTRVLQGVTYRQITPDGVHITDAAGADRLIEAHVVVIAAGQVADKAVPALAERAGVRYQTAGGARDADGLDAVRAFAEGFAAAAGLGTPDPDDVREKAVHG